MQGEDNAVVPVASNPTSNPQGLNDSAAQKADLLRQFAGAGNEATDGGGLIAQLANNPFFTAVSVLLFNRSTKKKFLTKTPGFWPRRLDGHRSLWSERDPPWSRPPPSPSARRRGN